MDGVCFLVHASNPVGELTREQLLGIYTGTITNWQQVGGRDVEITCINRADGRSELELVTKFLGIRPIDIVADLIAGENQQGIKMVATDENAITYMSVGASEYEVDQGLSIRMLPLDGVVASVANEPPADMRLDYANIAFGDIHSLGQIPGYEKRTLGGRPYLEFALRTKLCNGRVRFQRAVTDKLGYKAILLNVVRIAQPLLHITQVLV